MKIVVFPGRDTQVESYLWWWSVVALLLSSSIVEIMQGIMFVFIVVSFSGLKSLDLNRKRKCLEFDDHLKRVKFKQDKKKLKSMRRKNKKNLPEPTTIVYDKSAEKAYWKEYWEKLLPVVEKFKYHWKEYWERKVNRMSYSFVAITNGFNTYLPVKENEKSFGYTVSASDGMPIVFDTGASMSVSPRREDFVGNLEAPTTDALYGLKGKISVVGTGVVRWNVYDINGVTRFLKTQAHYIPEASTRLFSPQVYFQEQEGGEALIRNDHIELTLKEGTVMKFPYNPGSNIPLMLTRKQLTVGLTVEDLSYLSDQHSMSINLSVADEVNQNITAAQKELLVIHWKTGHANFSWLQALCSKPRADERQDLPFFDVKNPKASSCQQPLCVACQIAKQHRRAPREDVVRFDPKAMKLKEGHLEPGQMVSIDQYVSALPGRLPHTKGKEAKKDKFNGGTIFCDHASKVIWVNHQVSLRSGDTIISKRLFEAMASSCGVKVKSYHADNVPFDSHEFRAELMSLNQTITFSGTGAHHQNGIAERAIRTVTSWARAMLLHMIIHWPEMADLTLWPFALDYAAYVWNHLPGKENLLAPMEIFSSSKVPCHDILKRLRIWGCPVYVLDPKLQDGKKLPKWKPRARRGMFLGFSSKHSSTVSKVLNLVTGYVSPQYHVVYDELYSTVTTTALQLEELQQAGFTNETWIQLLMNGYERHEALEDEHPNMQLQDEWLTPAEINERQNLRNMRENRRRLIELEHDNLTMPYQPEPIVPMRVPRAAQEPIQPVAQAPEGANAPENVQPEEVEAIAAEGADDDHDSDSEQENEAVRRSTRVRTAPRRFIGE